MNNLQPEMSQVTSKILLAKIVINSIVLAGCTICGKLWENSNNRSPVVDQCNRF